MNTNKLLIVFGSLSILISMVTWGMDLSHMVEACMYCRNERTMISLLGILMLLPKHRYITAYFSLLFGFYGAYVAADQIFSYFFDKHFGVMLLLAICAFCFLVAQAITLLCILFENKSQQNSY